MSNLHHRRWYFHVYRKLDDTRGLIDTRTVCFLSDKVLNVFPSNREIRITPFPKSLTRYIIYNNYTNRLLHLVSVRE